MTFSASNSSAIPRQVPGAEPCAWEMQAESFAMPGAAASRSQPRLQGHRLVMRDNVHLFDPGAEHHEVLATEGTATTSPGKPPLPIRFKARRAPETEYALRMICTEHHTGLSHHVAWQATPPSQIYSKEGPQSMLCTYCNCILISTGTCSRPLSELIRF